MTYREYPPGDALRETVACLWSRDDAPGDCVPHRVLPDGCVDILIDVGCGEAVVVGTMTRALLVPADEQGQYCAVRFRPGGAAAFLGESIDTLTDLSVPLEELWPGARPLLDRILGAPSAAERVRLLAAGLADRAAACAAAGDPLVGATARAIERDPGLRVATLAASLGVSRQHLTRRVRRTVGIGPKELARVTRFGRVSTAACDLAPAAVDWAALAVDHGYADQAHLTREFRAFAGITPARYLAERSSIRSRLRADGPAF